VSGKNKARKNYLNPGLKDDIQKDRRKLLVISKSMLKGCDEMWVFGLIISKGMQEEIKFAKKHKIKIKYIPKINWSHI